MPRLKVLSLQMALPLGVDPRLIWPVDHPGEFPWPSIEDLTISFPLAEDTIYERLPTTLHSLALVCFPRYSYHYYDQPAHTVEGAWHIPVPPASEILAILRKCYLPGLDALKIEYREDGAEDRLLRYIAQAFPGLERLKIFRYRRQDRDDTPLGTITSAISPLIHLRTFSFHPDLLDSPGTLGPSGDLIPSVDYTSEKFAKRLHTVAEDLIPELPLSVTLVKFLWPAVGGHAWAVYHVVRDNLAENPLQIVYDPKATFKGRKIDLGPSLLAEAKVLGHPPVLGFNARRKLPSRPVIPSRPGSDQFEGTRN
ncbi:hypothetical protein C8Q79DRAFT_1023547 [Trametes meyenii]|nr:hypothetical protein C8Q79DRAFT_1023547 [Trametes meyenii]